jgi:hypothetical protein
MSISPLLCGLLDGGSIKYAPVGLELHETDAFAHRPLLLACARKKRFILRTVDARATGKRNGHGGSTSVSCPTGRRLVRACDMRILTVTGAAPVILAISSTENPI